MKRKMLITIPLTILAALAVAGTAAAHNATATPTCGGLAWSAVNYDKTVTNSIVVTVDGVTVHQDLNFKASDTGTSPWSQTAAHTWSVVVNAPGTQYDKSFSGTWQPCQVPTRTTPVTTVAPTTTLPQATTTIPGTTDATTTTSVVEVGEPPVPTTTTLPVVPTPAVTAPPNPNPVTYECVQDTFGNWIFSGTFIPCEGPRPTTTLTDVLVLTQVEPALPVTGGVDWIIIAVAGGIIIVGVFLVRRGRRVQ